MSGAVVTVKGSCVGAKAVGAKAVGAFTDKGIVSVGTCSTIVTLLPLEFLELEIDAPLILFYYA